MQNMNWILSVTSEESQDWVDMAKTWHPSVALQLKDGLESMGLTCRILHQVGNVRLKEDLTWDKALELGQFMEGIGEYENDVYERLE
ncbi:hypothetical protein [Ammoniphilus sp. CFH 90114]|uniref:hypothetical protein n=1 Tax=Ammoniphilus sp. CFH 90114 TaxID=2493665 RepID=UPI00100EF84B|nr:hypothetical protein [Ammoniphilus sp. CFH 90114]RXT15339.1 hypothetical protein EIZ39_03800 [Ammoniphilus sp. CFH 90114]